MKNKIVQRINQQLHIGKANTGIRDFYFQYGVNLYFADTVGPRLIGPIGTEDFSPLSQDNL